MVAKIVEYIPALLLVDVRIQVKEDIQNDALQGRTFLYAIFAQWLSFTTIWLVKE